MLIFFKIRNFLKIVPLAVIVSVYSVSCKQGNNYPRQTAVLDSLNVMVHSADSALNKVDTVTVQKYCDQIMTATELLKMAHKDSMSGSSAQIFKTYYSIRWELEKFLGRRRVMVIEMNRSMNQMAHLSHDLKYNLIKADSVPIFYSQEVKRATLLVESEKMGMASLNAQLPLYQYIAPKADSLIALVKNHKDI